MVLQSSRPLAQVIHNFFNCILLKRYELEQGTLPVCSSQPTQKEEGIGHDRICILNTHVVFNYPFKSDRLESCCFYYR